MGEVHPDLMRSAGGKTAFDEGRLRVKRALDTIMSDRGLSPAFPDDGHLLAVDGAAADIAGDLSSERGWHAPNNCGIGTVYPVQHKVARECVMRGLGLGDNHQPARVLVEAMDDTRPANPADPRQARAAKADQGVDESAVQVSWRGVDNQPCGLVDDDQMCILEADIERDRLRYGRRIYILEENYDKILAAADPQRRVAQCYPFTLDMAGLDQPFETCPRQRREMQGKRAIKALPGLAGTSKDGGLGVAGCIGFSRHDRAFPSHVVKGFSADLEPDLM